MIILNAGVPRSGTVLVNAILRELLRENRVPVTQANPHGPQLARVLTTLRMNGQYLHKTVLVHTHSWDDQAAREIAEMPGTIVFGNFRDPRDVCVSLMRLHDHDYETAMRLVAGSFNALDNMCTAVPVMTIPYELLVAEKRAHIFQIARRIGLWPRLDQVGRVDAATSVDRHKQVMEQVNAGEIDGLTRRSNTNRVLVEDPKTLINDRHIQSGVSGRWRAELTEAQQADATERLAPLLARFGYPDAPGEAP
ncbi:MAG: hypothetical protein AAFV19_16445 [Pseudomonadota bacterium]